MIDLVIPMVFPNDPEWQREYARHHTGNASRNVRFRSWGTEELLVRCCMKYMPWLHSIYLLLSGESQVQEWMNELTGQGANLKIVFHRQFIPEEHLPCFSSPCIEMFLHRIPGLSEQFIYANDDMFPLSPLSEDDFFRETDNGVLPCQNINEKAYPARPSIFHRACLKGLNMIAEPFGKHYAKTYLRNGHSFAPILKTSCEEVWRRHGEQIEKTLSPLKRKADSYNQYLYVYYQHLAGIEAVHAPHTQYAGKDVSTSRLADIIREEDAGIVCMNDNDAIADWEQRAETVRKEIERKLEDKKENGLDVLIIHYNTPELTRAAILSLWKHTPGVRVTVFDNSDSRPFATDGLEAYGKVNIIDNTKGQIVDWQQWLSTFPDKVPTPENEWGSAKHCYSVEQCLDRFPEGFILMDSDVLIKRDVTELADRNAAWKGGVQVNTRRFGLVIPRVIPYLCWINTPLLRKHGIRYFNGAKMWNLTPKSPDNHYDTGAWLLEACNKAGLEGVRAEIRDYVEHYAHGSWRGHKAPEKWLTEHKKLWYMCPDTKIYICTHTDFRNIVSDPVYEVVDAREYNGDRCPNGLHGSFYSELILYKYISERKDLPEYVGFCGYRKYYSFMDDIPDIPSVFSEYDAIAATPVTVKPDVRGQYARCHNVKDMDIVSGIIKEYHPDLWPDFEQSLRQSELYACNMFILRRADFMELTATLFDILDRYLDVVGTDIEERIARHPHDYHIGMNKVSTVKYQRRIGGFLGERIVNAILRHRFKKIKHYDKVITGKPAICP